MDEREFAIVVMFMFGKAKTLGLVITWFIGTQAI
jgi:hypothetical protein